MCCGLCCDTQVPILAENSELPMEVERAWKKAIEQGAAAVAVEGIPQVISPPKWVRFVFDQCTYGYTRVSLPKSVASIVFLH